MAKSTSIIIDVRAAGLNRADLLMREGRYPSRGDTPPKPGLEIAGIVSQAPNGTPFQPGDPVCALCSGGGFEEQVTVDEALCFPIPAHMRVEQAAALPEALFTCWLALKEKAAIKAGETLLLYGGASGIGTLAIQLAQQEGLTTVLAMASSNARAKAIEQLGATPIFYRDSEGNPRDWVSEVKRLTNGNGADIILDMAGGRMANDNLSAGALDGRIVTIALMDGATAELKLGRLFVKRLSWFGAMLSPLAPEIKAEMGHKIRTHWWPWVEKGKISPVIHQIFALQDADLAMDAMARGEPIGKIVLSR